ncbi:3'-5' exonuclease [Dasania marina]|uniref:3'-5' exonuclease n=1 Tax=Dasania marina TaxID=471499 RepID=UPI0030D8F7AA|tara:strand:- start:1009 stop:1614 length:606 start_codon:yes stop_codon:yes gene_type:complete
MSAEFIRPSKEEIRVLPLFEGISLDNIIVVDKDSKLEVARDVLDGVTIIGFDTESKPTFKKGEESMGPHVIQLATSSHALIFTPHFLPGLAAAMDILQSRDVTKYGFGLSGDKKLFRNRFGIEVKNTVDLASIVKRTFGLKQGVGARAAIAILFKQRLSKSAQKSNWGNYPLKPHQIKYAANDAYAGICVINALKVRGLVN